MRRPLLLCGLVAALLVAPGAVPAVAGDSGGAPAPAVARWAVGVVPGDFARTAAALPGARTLVPGRSLLVTGQRPSVTGARYVVRLDGVKRTLAFPNREPLAAQQWYLTQDRAWSYWPAAAPKLAPVRVAVIDSGIDFGHPEFEGRVIGGTSFVDGPWRRDVDGHGTFIAGIIAADPFNGRGIAGIAINAQLLIVKVVEPDGVSLEGEIKAIRWAADHHARVINLSLGGLRNPHDSRLDTYSLAERDAVLYARQKGAVVVAAVGNGPDAPQMPWQFANYPAALPHVIGVGAVRQTGVVPAFSNRDRVYLDLVAPGHSIFSTIPRNLVDTQFGCEGEPYSDCGPFEFRQAIGTSFAAPQVAAAAALLLGQDPSLTPDQVAWLLERSADDVSPQTGCARCSEGRDSLSGWGRLNVQAALKLLKSRTTLPPPDALEPNDDVGAFARVFYRLPRTITATLDFWDDPVDVFAMRLKKGQSVFATLLAPGAAVKLSLWKPRAAPVRGQPARRDRAAQSTKVDLQERLAYTAPAAGTYYLQVKLKAPGPGSTSYELDVSTRARAT
jgi:subtilisin family serine protease